MFLRDEQDGSFKLAPVLSWASIRGIISLIDLGCANLDVWFVVWRAEKVLQCEKVPEPWPTLRRDLKEDIQR
jgi:hypothetical protein